MTNLTTTEQLALTPWEFLTAGREVPGSDAPIGEWIKFAHSLCYGDDFKDMNGFRPRSEFQFTEDSLRRFYNSNYKVREYADGVNPFGGENRVYLGFSDEREAQFKQDRIEWEELEAQWEAEEAAREEELKWEVAEETGDFSEVQDHISPLLTKSQDNLGSIGLIFG